MTTNTATAPMEAVFCIQKNIRKNPAKRPLFFIPGKKTNEPVSDIRQPDRKPMTKEKGGVIMSMFSRAEIEEFMRQKEKEEAVLKIHHLSIWHDDKKDIYLTKIKKGEKKAKIQAKTYEALISRLYDFYDIAGNNNFESVFFAMTDEKQKQGATTKTTAEYTRLYNKYYKGQSITEKDIAKIDFAEWKLYFSELLKKYNLTKKQFKQVLIVPNQSINYAITHGFMSLNPIRDIMRSDLKFKPEPAYNQIKAKALTPAQAEKMKEWADKELENVKKAAIYAHALKFNLTAGTRYGELTGIKWSDIDFEEQSITIQRQLVFELEKDGETYHRTKTEKNTLKSAEEIRKIPLTAEMEKILSDVKALNLESDYVFPLRYHTYNDKIKEAAAFAGISDMEQIRTHTIRTTAATNLYRKCHNVKTVQALLGHNSPEMTNKYVKNLNCFEDLKAVLCD